MRVPSPCPSVSVQYFEGVNRSLMKTDGIAIADSTFLTLGIASQGKNFGADALATVTVSRFSSHRADIFSGPLSLSLDDSVPLSLSGGYSTDKNDGTRFEMISSEISLADLRRITAAKSISGTIAGKPFTLTNPQLQAFRNFAAQLGQPVTEQIISDGCARPAPLRVTVVDQSVIAMPDGVYFTNQVTKPAELATRSLRPDYPDELRKIRFEGRVMVQFVVMEDGTPAMSTFKVVRSDNDQFSVAVRNVVPRLRFIPAELNGRKVKQLIQVPFDFRLNP